MIRVAIVGYGYWGPNLVRNFAANDGAAVKMICDVSAKRLEAARKAWPSAETSTDYRDVIASDVDLVALSVPAALHYPMAKEAIEAGKHVLVEKPMCRSVPECDDLIERAAKRDVRIFVDHTFVFTPQVRRMAAEASGGNLGTLLYYDSVRINLGLFSQDASVTWDLAPHDLSILDFILGGVMPASVSCTEATHFDGHHPNIAYLTLRYPDNFIAHVSMNWLAPVKVRQVVLCGTQRMVVYDETDPAEKVRIYDRGVTLAEGETERLHNALIQYRVGDMHAPYLPNDEALAVEVAEVVACLSQGKEPTADHRMGRRVVRILEMAEASARLGGAPVANTDQQAATEAAAKT
ncbi:MAG TPA: Gfo/Idh/MocA family oxidoreductase [Candidatus Eremiobacteraceae bacterium]